MEPNLNDAADGDSWTIVKKKEYPNKVNKEVAEKESQNGRGGARGRGNGQNRGGRGNVNSRPAFEGPPRERGEQNGVSRDGAKREFTSYNRGGYRGKGSQNNAQGNNANSFSNGSSNKEGVNGVNGQNKDNFFQRGRGGYRGGRGRGGYQNQNEVKTEEPMPEPEPLQLTLEEYRQKESAKPKQFNKRMPGEGEPTNLWKGVQALSVKEQPEIKEAEKENKVDAEPKAVVKETKGGKHKRLKFKPVKDVGFFYDRTPSEGKQMNRSRTAEQSQGMNMNYSQKF